MSHLNYKKLKFISKEEKKNIQNIFSQWLVKAKNKGYIDDVINKVITYEKCDDPLFLEFLELERKYRKNRYTNDVINKKKLQKLQKLQKQNN